MRIFSVVACASSPGVGLEAEGLDGCERFDAFLDHKRRWNHVTRPVFTHTQPHTQTHTYTHMKYTHYIHKTQTQTQTQTHITS